MADTVDTKVLFAGRRIYAVRYTNISDGTGESAVAKLTLSGLIGPNGLAPTAAKIREISYAIQGFTSVRLFWDHTTDDEIAVLPTGVGYFDWTGVGGNMDPRTAGNAGNILFTTAGTTSGSSYDITIVYQLKD